MKIFGKIGAIGTTSKFSTILYNRSSRVGSFFDRVTYRLYKGAHMGFMYRLPIIGKRLR